jgi:hypothetical protein
LQRERVRVMRGDRIQHEMPKRGKVSAQQCSHVVRTTAFAVTAVNAAPFDLDLDLVVLIIVAIHIVRIIVTAAAALTTQRAKHRRPHACARLRVEPSIQQFASAQAEAALRASGLTFT